MVKRIKMWIINKLEEWLELDEMAAKIVEVEDDVSTTHNEFHDLEDTADRRNEMLESEISEIKNKIKDLEMEIAILKDTGGSITPAQIIDEWFNGKEVKVDG